MPSNSNTEQKAINLGQLKMAYEAGALLPVDISTLTPQSTFPKNAIIGINGVIYRAKKATSHFPVVLAVDGNAFVVDVVNGKQAFEVDDPTVHADWEQWTDAAIEYWIQQLNASIAEKATVADVMTATVSYGSTTFTVQQLLTEMAKLVGRTVVVDG